MTSTAKPSIAASVASVIEGVWLVVAFAMPLAVLADSAAILPFTMPKVFLVRTAAIALVVLMAAHWALRERSPSGTLRSPVDLGALLRGNTAIAAAVSVLAVTAISAALAPSPAIALGLWPAEFDNYSALSVGSYVVVFLAIALHLKRREQLFRLARAVTGGAMLVSLHGIGQHFGIDPLQQSAEPVNRAWMTFGNPIFAASYLIMTVPLTIAAWQARKAEMGILTHVWIGAGLVALQMTAISFTLSRGPLGALAGSLVLFVALAWWVFRWRAAASAAASLAVAAVFAVMMSYLPVEGTTGVSGELGQRLGTLGEPFSVEGGALSGRLIIWGQALEVYASHPWVDTVKFPELPDDGPDGLRALLGYGPEHFGYVYNQGHDTSGKDVADHGHNFIVHTLVEMGLLGVIAYGALVVAVAWALLRAFLIVWRGRVDSAIAWMVLAGVAVFAGRFVEQLVGKAQVADLTLTWLLAGAAVALPAIVARQSPEAIQVSQPANGKRGRNRKRTDLPAASPTLAGMAILGVLAVPALVFWWMVIAQPAWASVTVARGLNAVGRGDATRALRLMERGVDLSHGAEYAHWYLANGWLETSKALDDPQEEGQALTLADEAVRGTFEYDPMNWQSRMLAGVVSRRLAVLDPSRAEKAIHDYEIVVELLPALWEQWEQLAWTLTSVGEHERALEVVAKAKDLGGMGSDAYFLFYVEGKAYQGLGNQAEVDRIVEQLRGIDDPLTVPLIEDLTKVG